MRLSDKRGGGGGASRRVASTRGDRVMRLIIIAGRMTQSDAIRRCAHYRLAFRGLRDLYHTRRNTHYISQFHYNRCLF